MNITQDTTINSDDSSDDASEMSINMSISRSPLKTGSSHIACSSVLTETSLDVKARARNLRIDVSTEHEQRSMTQRSLSPNTYQTIPRK